MQHAVSHGFAYIAVVFSLAIFSVGLLATSEMASQRRHRQKEVEWISRAIDLQRAIREYYLSSPGVQSYPASLDQLAEDRRFIGTVRHIRRILEDPLTGKSWGLVYTSDGRIKGVFSTSGEQPSLNLPIVTTDLRVEPGMHYSDWKFVYEANNSASGVSE